MKPQLGLVSLIHCHVV